MRHPRKIERKIYSRRRRKHRWIAHRNFLRNRIKKSVTKKRKQQERKVQQITIPSDFTFANNIDKLLEFFASLEKINLANGRYIFFNFLKVRDISNGAITILLSQIGWLNDQGFYASGNYPEDAKCRDKIEKSGFLSFFKTVGQKPVQKSDDIMLAMGETKTASNVTARLVRKSSKTVWGSEERNVKLQGMLIELMANTINHAYSASGNQKGWYFTVNHVPEENKVFFCFVDNGQGILNTVHKKFKHKVASLVGIGDTLIEKAFEGEFGSRTQQTNRGRGLKAIKKVFEKGCVKALRVITNNVYYDFESGVVKDLKHPFNGTVYFWEINKNCSR